MPVERIFRDDNWNCFEAEFFIASQAADLAYLGANMSQATRLIGKRITGNGLRGIFKLLSPNMRREGSKRSGGRPKDARSLRRLPVPVKLALVSILQDCHFAMVNGADVVDARLAAWKVFDSAREAGHIDLPASAITLDIWLLVAEHVQKKRVLVSRCGSCGSANISVDQQHGNCLTGRHAVFDTGPFFVGPDGAESPLTIP